MHPQHLLGAPGRRSEHGDRDREPVSEPTVEVQRADGSQLWLLIRGTTLLAVRRYRAASSVRQMRRPLNAKRPYRRNRAHLLSIEVLP